MSLTLLQKSKYLLDEVVEFFGIRFQHGLGTEFPPTFFVRGLFGELHVIMLVLGGSFHSTLAHPAVLRKMRKTRTASCPLTETSAPVRFDPIGSIVLTESFPTRSLSSLIGKPRLGQSCSGDTYFVPFRY